MRDGEREREREKERERERHKERERDIKNNKLKRNTKQKEKKETKITLNERIQMKSRRKKERQKELKTALFPSCCIYNVVLRKNYASIFPLGRDDVMQRLMHKRDKKIETKLFFCLFFSQIQFVPVIR